MIAIKLNLNDDKSKFMLITSPNNKKNFRPYPFKLVLKLWM
jgi:hypothetical protein